MSIVRGFAVTALLVAAGIAGLGYASGIGVQALGERVLREGPGAVLAVLSGGPERSRGQGGAAPQPGPPPEVTASQPLKRAVTVWDEYTGRFEAVDSVDIRARASGYLVEVHIRDGQDVKKGDLLYTIDPRPFERAVALAAAELEQARVRVANARLDVERGKPLADRRIISEKTQDDRENVFRDAEAAVVVAEARLRSVELDLDYTRITAPVSGRLGRSLVTVGNWVSSGTSSGATLLATIVSQNPIYISFDVSENNALKYKRQAGAVGSTAQLQGMPVGVGLPDETGFPHAGTLDFVDNRLEQGTATLRARAVIANPKGLFTPGMFARVRVAGETERPTILIPDEAIGTDQAARFVYVVSEDGSAQRRPVRLGQVVDGLRVVRDGVTTDDWVVTRGIQKVRPGQKVAVRREPIKISEAQGSAAASRR